MDCTGEAIVASARSWLSTRFHHQGRLKKSDDHKGGVDCLGLLMGVADELALTTREGTLLAWQDETNYAHYPDCRRLREKLTQSLVAIPQDSIMRGDILLLNVDYHPQHLAIVSDFEGSLGMIHAYAPARAVVEHALDSWWFERIEAAFRYEKK